MRQLENTFNDITIPEFDNYIRQQSNVWLQIESTKLMVEVLWWIEPAKTEFEDSSFSSKVILDWQFSLVVRYKKKNWTYYPTCALSFNMDDNWNVVINQLQWARTKSAYKVSTSFMIVDFYVRLLEESFSKKWIYISVKSFPTWLENASYSSQAPEKYDLLRKRVMELNQKYWLKQNTLDDIAA